MSLTFWAMLILGVGLSAFGGLFLKLGAIEISHANGLLGAVVQVISNWKIMVGVAMYFIPVAIWIYLLKYVDLSFLQPLFSLVYVATPILSTFVLNEKVGSLRWAGIFIVCIGVATIAKSGADI